MIKINFTQETINSTDFDTVIISNTKEKKAFMMPQEDFIDLEQLCSFKAIGMSGEFSNILNNLIYTRVQDTLTQDTYNIIEVDFVDNDMYIYMNELFSLNY